MEFPNKWIIDLYLREVSERGLSQDNKVFLATFILTLVKGGGSIHEIAYLTNIPERKVRQSLKKLLSKGKVMCIKPKDFIYLDNGALIPCTWLNRSSIISIGRRCEKRRGRLPLLFGIPSLPSPIKGMLWENAETILRSILDKACKLAEEEWQLFNKTLWHIINFTLNFLDCFNKFYKHVLSIIWSNYSNIFAIIRAEVIELSNMCDNKEKVISALRKARLLLNGSY